MALKLAGTPRQSAWPCPGEPHRAEFVSVRLLGVFDTWSTTACADRVQRVADCARPGPIRIRAGSGATSASASASLEDLAVTTYDPGLSDMGPILSSGQGEAAATTVVAAAASLTG